MIVIFDGVEVSDYVIDFSVDSPLGIDENENKNFNIFPNPSSLGYININSKNSETITANVFDVLGKQVIIDGAVNDNRLDVINLSPGLYFIKLTQNNTTVTKKLIIK